MHNPSQAPNVQTPGPTLAGPRTQLKRHPERGSHERATVEAIIDEAPLCHLAFVIDGQAMALPTAHVRIDDQLYLHGAAANRMLRSLRDAARASATFTLVDGFVLARTAFHHSMNFRSAVVFGPIAEVTDRDEKLLALHALIEHMAPGRMQELGQPSDAELNTTLVLRLSVEEASAKVRTGPPLDGPADHALDVWAGEVPIELRAKRPVRDPALRTEQLISGAAEARAARHNPETRERWHGDYLLSTDHSRLQFAFIHRFLAEESYWAHGVSEDDLHHAIGRSLCFGVYRDGQQLGFARVVSDRTRFAYLCDVFVQREQRARGLGRALIDFVLEHPEVRNVQRFVLGTRDAHAFYEPFGWQRAPSERYMVRQRP
jgi:nitroimidazol reductase NimA-like FMN-containing flavoprotein (pyridoxamine 5'-phosphate oxidase superfamily)/GNAT superfamily N-acetyltransferase